MTDRREIERFIARARQVGATVRVKHDADGSIETITVRGLTSFPTRALDPLSFAEAMREHAEANDALDDFAIAADSRLSDEEWRSVQMARTDARMGA